MKTRIGLISDTHGELPSEVHSVFEGVAYIFHAGDVGDENVLIELETIAPVVAVRGNTDTFEAAQHLPEKQILEIGQIRVGLTHGHQVPIESLYKDLKKQFSEKVEIIVFGHTHWADIRRREGILFINPGCGHPYKFDACTVALLEVDSGKPRAKIIPIAKQ